MDGWPTLILDNNCTSALRKWYTSVLVSAADGKILDGSIHYEENTEALVVVFKEAGLGVSAEEIRSKLWSCFVDNAGQSECKDR